MNKINKPSHYTNENDKLVNANYYWNDEQLRVMRGLNIPIWYTPVLKAVAMSVEDNKKIEITQYNIETTNKKECLTKKIVHDDYKVLNLNNNVITDYINFNDISNSINNSLDSSFNNYLFITNSVDKYSIDIVNNIDNEISNNNNFFIDNVNYSLLYNISDSLKWVLNKQDNKSNKQGNKQENNYFVMPVQFNLNEIITTLKPKAICVMGHSLIHCFENDNKYLLRKNTSIQDKLNTYDYNGIPLIFINSLDEIRNNLILKSNIWFTLNAFLNFNK